MAYATAGLRCVLPAMGDSQAIFTYSGADTHTDVDAAGFFTDGVTKGMKVGDIVIVTYTTGYLATLHAVASVSGTAATISSAVLA